MKSTLRGNRPLYAYVGSYTTPERGGQGNGINVYRVDRRSGAFTHVQQGPRTTIRFLRGFFPGMWSFAMFCLVATLGLDALGKWVGFALALTSVIPIQMAVLWWGGRAP